MREMKNSGFSWLGEIPKNWSMQRVKHGFTRKNEKAMRENPVILSLARTGVKVRDISNNEGQIAESYFNYNPVEPGDLLLNPMDLYSGANCSVSNVSGVISPAYINLKSKDDINPFFYDYYFKVQYWMMAFFSYGKGVSFDNRWTLNAETLMNYPIVALPYDEQCKIADYLDKKCSKIDAIIEKQQAVIEKLKEYKLSVITEAVTKGLKSDTAMKDSEIPWIGSINASYDLAKIGTFCFVTKLAGFEYTDTMEQNISDDAEVPIVRAQNVRMHWFNDEINEFIPMDVSKKLSRCALDKKCLLITFIGAGIGDVCFFDKSIRYHLAPNVAKIVIRDEFKETIDEEYLMYYLSSYAGKGEINKISKASAQPSLSMGTIRGIRFVLPTKDIQIKISAILNEKCNKINKNIENRQKIIEKMSTYKKSLIYEVVTGKKEV